MSSMPLVLEPSWVGRRITVRRVVERRPDGSLKFSDVVGDLIGLDAQTAVVDGRGGPVEVPLPLVAAAKLVPPSTADELRLEEIAARGWRAPDTSWVGGWLLRAAGGFTRRANSVLPLRAPGMPLDEALAAARAWYAARGLPLRLKVPTEARRLLDAELAERGWPASPGVYVMTARLDVLPADGDAEHPVELADAPSQAWLRSYRSGAAAAPAARAVLTDHPKVAFASVHTGDGNGEGKLVAIGRGTVDREWLGITAVEVAPEHRRGGLGRALTRALEAWGRTHGAFRSHLQVAAANEAAVALYQSLGYHVHHEYRYRREPEPAAGAS